MSTADAREEADNLAQYLFDKSLTHSISDIKVDWSTHQPAFAHTLRLVVITIILAPSQDTNIDPDVIEAATKLMSSTYNIQRP